MRPAEPHLEDGSSKSDLVATALLSADYLMAFSGHRLLRIARFQRAVEHYTGAIHFAQTNGSLFGSRSAAYCAMDRLVEAEKARFHSCHHSASLRAMHFVHVEITHQIALLRIIYFYLSWSVCQDAAHCISLSPESPDGYVCMGRVRLKLGDKKAALEAFTTVRKCHITHSRETDFNEARLYRCLLSCSGERSERLCAHAGPESRPLQKGRGGGAETGAERSSPSGGQFVITMILRKTC